MSRFLTLLPLLMATLIGTPAAAQVSPCKIAEQVYGITRTGDLIVQPFCSDPRGGFAASRTLAAFGAEVPQLFYGGQLEDDTVVIYGIGADGKLRWYKENAAGRLEPGVVVGLQFGDWRRYQHLQSDGGGDLTGVDGGGRLWRWVHTGWQDGTDTWAAGGPEQDGMACPGARPVFAGRPGPDRYVGVDSAETYVFCGFDGVARIASELPPGMVGVTMAAGPGVAYALREADHRLVRMTLDANSATPFWLVDSSAPVSLAAVFTGRSILDEHSPPMRYEWQWTWYTE